MSKRIPTKNELEKGRICHENGIDDCCDKYNISKETAKRYRRMYRNSERNEEGKDITSSSLLSKLAERYTQKELKAILKGGLETESFPEHIHDFNGDSIKIGFITDTHLGSKYTDPDLLNICFDEFAKQEVDIVMHAGDVTEGLSNRQGHVYELTHIGYESQREHAIEVLGQWDITPFYMISGNHDLWYKMSNGANMVSDICNRIPNANFLGDHEGNITIGSANIRLWHGADGSSYAHSYRAQKVIESFTGGDKPHLMLAGHVHKAGYFFDRHVHFVSGGSIERQSKWMRSKRLPAHTGFWIVEVGLNNSGIGWINPRWYPFYL